MAIKQGWIASDGKAFLDKCDAEAHERELREAKIEAVYDKLEELLREYRGSDADLIANFILKNSTEVYNILDTIHEEE